jgi:small nuclear ribonucleoprotein (snRNP)-like protein
MNGWMYWMDKKIFLVLKSGRKYEGKVIDVDVTSVVPLVWITIIDKFGKRVTFVHSEIETIQEEVR